jgi:hypothetical protein
MRSIQSKAFDLVNSLGETINTLKYDTSSGLYKSPYTEVDQLSFDTNDKGLTMYRTEDIAFVNTSEFSRTGKEYLKTGKYTKAHPKYDAAEYKAFWDEEERRCIEGYSVPGKLIKDATGNYALQDIHITGEHYGYLNFGEIKRSKGFEVNKGIITNGEGEALKQSSIGGVKDFFFPDFWDGDYYFFKAIELCRKIGKHLVVGKARRKGYSYKNGWIVANKANLQRRSTSVVGAYDAASLFDDGTMNKVMNYLDFICKNTDWNKRRLHNTLEHLEIGFRYKGDDTKRGFLSNIYTAILKGNPGGMRGKDADLLLLEESGKCPNLSEILDATLKTLSDGIYTTGLFVAFGTGGGDDNQWQGFEDLFYDVHARKFIAFENIFDDDMLGTSCGYFHGSFMNKPGLIDIHGNSDIKGSVAFNNAEKSMVSHDPSKLNALEMEEPEKPSEAFSRAANNIFPAKDLDGQLRRLMHDPNLKGIGREGIFIQNGSRVKFLDRLTCTVEEASTIPPVVDNYPLNPKDDLRGCWMLWEQPYRNPVTGLIPDDLYSLWNDPYGISKDKDHITIKDSLGVTWLYENPNNFTTTKGDRIVGCFVGRREDTEEYDDQMFLGCMYFNGKILYENDRGDVFSNAKKRGLLDLLKTEPEFHYQKDLAKGGGGRKRGVSIAGNSGRKLNGVLYLKKWLMEKRGIDNNGNNILNLHYFYSIGGIKELLKYDGKRNADRVSGLIVGMFDIRETLYSGIIPDNPSSNEVEDDYFTNPFNNYNT